jgi:RNA polymerase sigma factor (sigma-70 family)
MEAAISRLVSPSLEVRCEGFDEMASDQTTHLQFLLDRLRQGDDSARRELIGCAYERLRLLAWRTLHKDFHRFEKLHETDSILDEAVVRLLKALEQEQPTTLQGFFALAAKKIREVLLDVARQQRRRRGEGLPEDVAPGCSSESSPRYEAADTTHDPATLAEWSEFHKMVEALPEEERAVVDLHWYQGLTQAETAAILGISQRQVSRLWIRATGRLPDCVS